MNLQAEKLEIVRMILDTDDKKIIQQVKSFFNSTKASANQSELDDFYNGFKKGIHEVKLSLDGKTELKDAKNWLDEL